jgi:hypothetical protein
MRFIIPLFLLFDLQRLLNLCQVVLEVLAPAVDPLDAEINAASWFRGVIATVELVKAFLDHLVLQVVERYRSHTNDFVRCKGVLVDSDYL